MTGLCAMCRWVHHVTTTKGSSFVYCTRSETDPSYPRYPRLPVIECRGYEPIIPEE